jgi:hypothetical protein
MPISNSQEQAKMTDTEIALRAAINLLRDSVESGNMPSGERLTIESQALHERAAEQLERLLADL